MKNVAIILPSSLNLLDQTMIKFLSELSLVTTIDEYSIKVSWYIYENHAEHLSSDAFIKDALHIRDSSKIYRSIEAALVSHICHGSKTKEILDIVAFLPSDLKEPLVSNKASYFSSSDSRIVFVSNHKFPCSNTRHFSASYKDILWPARIIQFLLGNVLISEQNNFSETLEFNESISKQTLFWLCTKCFTGIKSSLILAQNFRNSSCLCQPAPLPSTL